MAVDCTSPKRRNARSPNRAPLLYIPHPMKFPALALTVLLAVFAPAFSQAPKNPADEYEARKHVSADGKTLNYRLLKPLNYDATKKYPLVLFLHGAGERGDDNVAQLKHGTSLYINPTVREKYACFVVAPQCPREEK